VCATVRDDGSYEQEQTMVTIEGMIVTIAILTYEEKFKAYLSIAICFRALY
jgi:hypothetical protein